MPLNFIKMKTNYAAQMLKKNRDSFDIVSPEEIGVGTQFEYGLNPTTNFPRQMIVVHVNESRPEQVHPNFNGIIRQWANVKATEEIPVTENA